MLNGVAHTHQKTQPIVIVLVAIALVAAVADRVINTLTISSVS
ncbi:MAG: hypothetical protein WBE34_18780 [Candidatus Nitrosopolaris sp.]